VSLNEERGLQHIVIDDSITLLIGGVKYIQLTTCAVVVVVVVVVVVAVVVGEISES